MKAHWRYKITQRDRDTIDAISTLLVLKRVTPSHADIGRMIGVQPETARQRRCRLLRLLRAGTIPETPGIDWRK